MTHVAKILLECISPSLYWICFSFMMYLHFLAPPCLLCPHLPHLHPSLSLPPPPYTYCYIREPVQQLPSSRPSPPPLQLPQPLLPPHPPSSRRQLVEWYLLPLPVSGVDIEVYCTYIQLINVKSGSQYENTSCFQTPPSYMWSICRTL